MSSVPFLKSYYLTESGLILQAQWGAVHAHQTALDRGDNTKAPRLPRKYSQKDYLAPEYWQARGGLDVPLEPLISYPGCESDQDGEPVYGWAGWDHLQRAQALAALYLKRRDGEGWTAERLTPMLAGVLELIPWVKQWHNEPSAEFNDLRMGEYFEQFLDGECRQHGLTHDDLRAWRPEKKRAKAKAAKAAKAPKEKKPAKADDEQTEPALKKPRARKAKAPAAEPADHTDVES